MNYLFLDNGFEEIEAITTIDLLRRANIALTTVSITGSELVLGAHNIAVKADGLIEKIDFSDAETLILPGGATKLGECAALCDLLVNHNKENKLIAAICAAPSILGKMELLIGKKACCFPSFEDKLIGADVSFDDVCVADNIITSRGAGTAHKLAFKLVEILKDKKTSDDLRSSMIYDNE